jgi:hypothetical protein
MVSDKEQLRDISSIGLKTVISELPLGSSGLASNVCKRITGRLSNAIEKVSEHIHLFILVIMTELYECNHGFVSVLQYFSKFGFILARRMLIIANNQIRVLNVLYITYNPSNGPGS